MRLAIAFLLAAPLTFAQTPVIQSILSASDYSTLIAPGSWVAIFGTNLAPSETVVTTLPLPLQVGGVTVSMYGTNIPLRYVSPGQINALIPFLGGIPVSAGFLQFAVTTPTGTSAPYEIAFNTLAPSIYTQNATGSGAALAFDGSFRPLTKVGTDPILLYASGLGPTNPAADAAVGGSSTEPLNRIINSLGVTIGGQIAQVAFAGLAPGLPGVYQLNVVPPATAPSDNSLLISFTVIGNNFTHLSSNATTLPVTTGTNVKNVSGTITQTYPVSGTVLGQSAFATIAGVTAAFDIASGAQPFALVATCQGGSETVNFDPGAGTWQASVSAPNSPSRLGDFSGLTNSNGQLLAVYDFLDGSQQFPQNVVPPSRLDPVAKAAFQAVPLPNLFPTSPPPLSVNGTYFVQGKIPSGGHVVIDANNLADLSNFGGFTLVPAALTRTGCYLTIDGAVIASETTSFR